MRIYLQTFGCRANHYDSERVRAVVEGAGHVMVRDAAAADVAVFNSCAVTAEAVSDLRKSVRRVARRQPGIRSIVMGCASALDQATHGADTLHELPNVDALIAGADLSSLAAVLDLPSEAALTFSTEQSSTRALLRIQDGCDEHCTFCATRLARGTNRSRPVGELVDEAQRLADHHPEIVLTGVHIGAYGSDVGSSLGTLVETLVSQVARVRFRLSSLEATEVDDRLLDLLTGDATRVCPYLHAPLQSGSDRVLRRMGRHWYTAETYATAVERIVARRPVFGLGADVITGFPGETEADHRRTAELVERLPFTYLHVFPFSPRPGTAAERLAGVVPQHVAHDRSLELRDLARSKAAAYTASRAGGQADVVVIGGGPRREGLTEDYLSVLLPDGSFGRGERFPASLRHEADALSAVCPPLAPSP